MSGGENRSFIEMLAAAAAAVAVRIRIRLACEDDAFDFPAELKVARHDAFSLSLTFSFRFRPPATFRCPRLLEPPTVPRPNPPAQKSVSAMFHVKLSFRNWYRMLRIENAFDHSLFAGVHPKNLQNRRRES